MDYEELSLSHFLEWEHPVDLDPEGMTGFAARRDGELVAIACFYCEDARWWCAFRRTDRCLPSVHAMTLKAFNALRAADVREVWALLDETRPRARIWMERLGFELVTETEWRLRLWPSSPQQ